MSGYENYNRSGGVAFFSRHFPLMRFPSLYVWQLSRCSVCFFFGALCVIFCGFNCVCCVFACCAFLCCIFVSCVVVGALCWFSFPSCIFYFWFLSLDLCFVSCIFRSCLRPAAAAALKSSHLVRSASDCRNSAAAAQLFCFFALSAHLSALRWADCVLARVGWRGGREGGGFSCISFATLLFYEVPFRAAHCVPIWRKILRMAAPIAFLHLWPEVKSYRVTVTVKGRNPAFHRAHIGEKELAEKAEWLLQLADSCGAHFFVRPEHPSAILVDLDRYEDAHLPAIKGLRPRCIVRTSEDKRHAWFWVPRLTDAQGSVVRKDFASALLGDCGSTGAYQCGRMPGSRNPKNGYEVGLAYAAPGAESSWALLKEKRTKLLARTPETGERAPGGVVASTDRSRVD